MEENTNTWENYQETKKQVDVIRFLNSLGYKRSTKQFSIDVNKGLIKPNERGLFTRRNVHQYAKRFLITGDKIEGTPEGYESQKLRLQVEKLERENEEGAFKFGVLKGKYIPRQEMYLHLAGRAAVLDSALEQMVRAKASELITLVSGSHAKIPDFVDIFLSDWKNLINNYANSDELEVIFTGEVIDDGED